MYTAQTNQQSWISSNMRDNSPKYHNQSLVKLRKQFSSNKCMPNQIQPFTHLLRHQSMPGFLSNHLLPWMRQLIRPTGKKHNSSERCEILIATSQRRHLVSGMSAD